MGSELVKKQEILPAPIVTADNFEGLVREELGKIGEGFLRLGFYLSEAKNKELYIPLGYDDVFEMAEDLFSIKETTTYNLMAVWYHYHDRKNPLKLDSLYKGFSFSQLVECKRDKWGGVGKVVKTTDNVKTVGAKVTAWNYLVEKMSCWPSLEQVEAEIERRAEEKAHAKEKFQTSEISAPELNGQLPGQTSLFVEGYLEEPQEQEEETPEKFQTSEKFQLTEKTDENPFEGLPQETEIYADMLVKDCRAEAVEVVPDEVFPSENQMNIHKRSALSYIEIMANSTYAEGVDHFFEITIKRLVAMRACKLQALKGAKK